MPRIVIVGSGIAACTVLRHLRKCETPTTICRCPVPIGRVAVFAPLPKVGVKRDWLYRQVSFETNGLLRLHFRHHRKHLARQFDGFLDIGLAVRRRDEAGLKG